MDGTQPCDGFFVADCQQIVCALLASVADGALAPGQGAQLVGAIAQLARVAEIDELAQRVAALEIKNEKP